MPGFSFIKEWAPVVAQAVIAPIGMATMTAQPMKFMEWALGVFDRLNPPSSHMLIVDKFVTPISISGLPLEQIQKHSYGIIFVDAIVFNRNILEKYWEYIAQGGYLIVYEGLHIQITAQKSRPVKAAA